MSKSNWIPVEAGTQALEIPNAGCLVKKDGAMCFVPNAKIEKTPAGGKLVGTRTCETLITWTSGDPKTASTGWVGDAGERLDAKLKALNLTDELNKFIQKTWKITPTVKQLSALRTLIGGH
jgi:hypothetical protein